MNNNVIKNGISDAVDTESTLLADMYANRLVSQIENSGDRISLTFTGQGALAFAKALIAMVDARKDQIVESKHEDSTYSSFCRLKPHSKSDKHRCSEQSSYLER